MSGVRQNGRGSSRIATVVDGSLVAGWIKQGLERLDQVRFAVLQTTGDISIIPEPPPPMTARLEKETRMLDLNTATAEALDAVPELRGHGFEIVRYREERGRFDAVRQLEEVPGLAGKWDAAAGRLTVL